MNNRVIITVLLFTILSSVVAGATQKQPPKKPAPALSAKAQDHYRMTCQPCHGVEGKGALPGTDLTTGTWKHGSSLQAVAKTISEGVPGTAMLPARDRFTTAEILELSTLVRSFDKAASRKPPAKK